MVSPAVGVRDEREINLVSGVRLDVPEPPLLIAKHGWEERVGAVGTLRRGCIPAASSLGSIIQ